MQATEERNYTIYSPTMQEFMVFRPSRTERGLVHIRYLSTIEGLKFKPVNGIEYGNIPKGMLLDNAREVWYALVKEGWNWMAPAKVNLEGGK